MYCSHCGKQVVPGSNFCSHCGVACNPAAGPGTPLLSSKILRPRHPRAIAGVCSGFALHFGWDLTLVRILTVVFTLITSGVGLLVYLAAWVLMPDAPYELTPGGNQQGTVA